MSYREECGCSACVHDRFVASTRKALLPSSERIQQARAALVQALNLLDELSPCDCPKCAPEEWGNWSEGWRKNGYTKAEYPCKIS